MCRDVKTVQQLNIERKFSQRIRTEQAQQVGQAMRARRCPTLMGQQFFDRLLGALLAMETGPGCAVPPPSPAWPCAGPEGVEQQDALRVITLAQELHVARQVCLQNHPPAGHALGPVMVHSLEIGTCTSCIATAREIAASPAK